MKIRNKKTSCDNCGNPLAPEVNYCPNCGQENHVPNKPFRHLFLEIFETLFHFDTKFLKSAKYLLLYPGRITKEYNENKRARFVPPFRLYIFVSAIFFLLFQLQSKRIIENEAKLNPNAFIFESNQPVDSCNEEVTASKSISFRLKALDIEVASEKQRDSLLNLSDAALDSFFIQHGKIPQPYKKAFFRQILKFSQSKWEAIKDVWIESVHYFSISLILLMPIMGVIVQLLNIRQKRNYYDFLMFSLHYHTAFFSIFSIGFIFNFVKGFEIWPLVILLLMFLYLWFALRENYQQGWIKTFFKSILISVLYTIVVLFGIFGATLFSIVYS